jgi:hypothetical protein
MKSQYKSKKSSKKGGGFNPKRELSDGSAYGGQQKVRLRLEGIASLILTTVTTGVATSAYTLGSAGILGFATRFGSTFDEYRVLGADVRITPLSASVGVSKMWFDEKSTATPTSNEAQERTCVPLANTNAMSSSRKIMRWRARDLLDLQYSPIGTATTPATFKVYSDNANFGASVVATPLWLVEPVFVIEFRGLKST